MAVSQIIENLKNPSKAKEFGISPTTATKIRGQLENFLEGEKNLRADIKKINTQIGDVKFNNIFGGVNFEHTLAKQFGKDYKYLPRNYLLKGQFTSQAFNMMKKDAFDLPLIKLMKQYEQGKVSGAKVQEFIDNFNAKTNNYADFKFDVDKGKLGYTDSKVSYDLSRYNDPNVARQELIDNIKLTQSDTFQKGMKNTVGSGDQLKLFKSKEAKEILSQLEKLGCGRAAGGRILFSKGTPDASLTECGKKGIARFMDDLKKGNYSKASLNILKGGGNLIKNIANPMELLKLRNLIGPGAMGLMAAFEAGVITDDVIRQGTPLNESLANNWLTKTFLPYTQEYAKAKNLLESGTVPSNMKKYVQDVVTFNESLKDIQGIENRVSSRLIDDTGYGMIDGSSVYSQKQQEKEDADVMKKISSITDYNFLTPGTAKDLEYNALKDENEATRMAKKEFSPIFGFDKLKDVRTPGSTSFDYIPDETPKDFRPITYKDAEYEDKKLPLGLEQAYMNKFNLKPRDSLSKYTFDDSDRNVLEELTETYNKSQRAKQASQYPGYYGTQEKFMEGGIASLNVKK